MPNPARKKLKGSGRRASPQVTIQREQRAWDMALRSFTHAEIARELKVDRSTVTKMLDRIDRRELAELSERVARSKARQTAQLNLLYREAWEAWGRSKLPERTTRESSGQGGDKVISTVKSRDGSPEFLARCQSFLADIRKIWGMDAQPDRDDGDGEAPPHPDVVEAMARGIAEGLRTAGASGE